MSEKHIDEISGVATTGHEWDGIRELNNPLPRWWVWTFYATIVWALAYTVAYPAWPLLTSATPGVLGWSTRLEVRKELDAAQLAKADYTAAVASKSVEEILADDNLRTFATAAGAAAFRVNCVQCHGSGAEGSKGYPNLNDDDWLWGGTIGEIKQTIAHGIRFTTDDDTRFSEMTAFQDVIEPEEITAVSSYVASMMGFPADASLEPLGKEVFAAQCASCHGEDAKGLAEFGAPNLTDSISLLVHSEADIESQVRAPKHGVMPAWQGRLGETTVKELATYVYSLGGGQ